MSEETLTDWIPCQDAPWYPTFENGGFMFYRIRKKKDGLVYFQRHEWKCFNGKIEIQEWIPTNP